MPDGAGTRQEILVVLGLGLAGLLLGMLAAFTPWYTPSGPSRPVVVELHAPAGQTAGERTSSAAG